MVDLAGLQPCVKSQKAPCGVWNPGRPCHACARMRLLAADVTRAQRRCHPWVESWATACALGGPLPRRRARHECLRAV
eukprot:336865-Chlamydomonas_euryale.AAC.1